MAMGALRFSSRLFAWQRGTNRVGLRVAIIGSRDAGAEAIREMLRTPVAGFVPVAVFDDDAHTHGLSLIGVPVVGGIDDIPAAAARYTIQQVLLAIPNPAPELVERALRASEAAGVSMKILPSARDMAAGKEHTAPIRQAREPRIEDLLGRTTVSTDLNTVRRSITGQRVLITGAGGSIGSEIARQVAEFNPAQLLLLDHDETHLHDIVGHPSRARRAAAGRRGRPRRGVRGLPPPPARRRVPRRRPQARAGPRVAPRGGGERERVRDRERGRGRRRGRDPSASS